MEVKLRQKRYRIFFILIIILIPLTTILVFIKKDSKSKSMEKNNIFQSEIEILSIPLGETSFNLNYEMGDLDISSDRIPSPITYHPIYGLYLVNLGSSEDVNPILERFTNNGRRSYYISLTEKLKLEDPFSFSPISLFIDSSGNLSLLASLSYNANLDRNQNFLMANFDLKGDISEIINMDEFFAGYPIFRSKDGYIWTYVTKDMTTNWCVYDSRGELKQQIKTTNNSILLPNGSLLALESDRVELYSRTSNNHDAKIQGSFEIGDEMIGGNGNFFGILTYPDDEYQERPDGYLEQSMIIQLFYFDPVSHTLFTYGKNELKPNIFDSEDIPRHFEYYDHNLMSFDENGNFYFIGRYGPKPSYIKVFCMHINPEVLINK